ncbi:MAG: hypothetical protein GY869_10580 [Planctomycetes bacterium]|nr:hypothetical protein [Planctomycetota bacterium]
MQRRAPAPTVVVYPAQTGLATRLMFVDSMRRSLRRIAPRPVVYHETTIINQPPPGGDRRISNKHNLL